MNSPPIASISVAIVRAVGRRSVPLKNMCSTKWAIARLRRGRLVAGSGGHDEQATELTCGIGAVRDTDPVAESCLLEDGHRGDGIDSRRAGTADQIGHRRAARVALAGARARGRARLPAGARILFAGCGTSYRGARVRPCGAVARARPRERAAGGRPRRDQPRGGTRLTLEAVERFPGETWLVTGAADSPLARARTDNVVSTPELEQSYCHTSSYTCAIATGRALQGEDVSELAVAVERELAADPLEVRARTLRRCGWRRGSGDRARGRAQAPRRRPRGRRGASRRAAPARPPRGDRPRRPLLRARGRGTGLRAGGRRDARAPGRSARRRRSFRRATRSWTSSASSAWPATSPRRGASTQTSSAGTRSPGTRPAGRTPDRERRTGRMSAGRISRCCAEGGSDSSTTSRRSTCPATVTRSGPARRGDRNGGARRGRRDRRQHEPREPVGRWLPEGRRAAEVRRRPDRFVAGELSDHQTGVVLCTRVPATRDRTVRAALRRHADGLLDSLGARLRTLPRSRPTTGSPCARTG